MWSKNYVTDDQIVHAIKNSNTMVAACAIVRLKFSTFKRRAIALGLYKTNQGRPGIRRNAEQFDNITFSLEDILAGKHPSYLTSRLRKRLISVGLKQNKCEECSLAEWRGKSITCELHHIDGDNTNHRLHNLKILCPNCHSQTGNFGKRKKRL